MKRGWIIAISIVLALILIVLASMGTLWANRNTAVELEERVEAMYSSNQSNYDNMWKKFVELTQVSDLQAKHYKDVYMGLIEGRYQDQGVLFKMVKEDNPQLGNEVYTQIQREISAGRNTFDNNQKALLDVIRQYNTFIRKKIVMTAVTGRQKINNDDYIVTSDKTSKAFDSGKDDVIDLTNGG